MDLAAKLNIFRSADYSMNIMQALLIKSAFDTADKDRMKKTLFFKKKLVILLTLKRFISDFG